MARTTRGPSMHDVAARAGVSHQTVSRVLNDFSGIRPETKARVLEAIDELGYRRNMAARALATGRSEVIGVIMPEAPHFGPTSTLYAIERAAREEGLKPLITTASLDPASMEEALDFLLGRAVDGIVVMAQHPSVLATLDGVRDVPVVYVLTGNAHGDRSVAVDQETGTRLALQHLYDLGHRTFQHVAGVQGLTEAELRRSTFAEFIRDHGLVELPVLEADWSATAGYEAGLQVDDATTAVFCANDPLAMGVIHALAERGRKVPEQVSVVGFDDVPEAAHWLPGLTTVHQDFAAVGMRTVARLVAAIHGDGEAAADAVEPWLVERGSTAPAP